ncbi:MAG: TVP38/TMEM64 family protein, partial [Nitrospirales bacterium]
MLHPVVPMYPDSMSAGSHASSPSGRSSYGKLILAGVVLAAIGAFYLFDLQRYLSLEALKANRDALLAFTEQHYGPAVGLYILSYILQTTFSLPGGAILTLAGGFLFGALLGTLYV